VQITPFSVARARKYGILAWYAAEPDVALPALEHAASIGGDFPQVDHQTLLLMLAMARFQRGDAAGLTPPRPHCQGPGPGRALQPAAAPVQHRRAQPPAGPRQRPRAWRGGHAATAWRARAAG